MTVPVYNMTDTWNNAGTVFTAILMNVTNTASAAGSLLLDLQIASASIINVRKDGTLTLNGAGQIGAATFTPPGSGAATGFEFLSDGNCRFHGASAVDGQGLHIAGAAGSGSDISLTCAFASNLAIVKGTTAQGVQIYNTATDTSNYERLALDWTTTANTATIDVQVLGTGTQRVISLKHLDSATGAGTATFTATNCPASTLTSPYTWIKVTSSDGSTVYMPAWK